MPRATTREQLLHDMADERNKLEKLLGDLSPEQMVTPGVCGEWSIKDMLAHISEWQRMLLGWYEAGLRGEKPGVPADDLKWSETPILNERIYQQYRETPLDEVLADFRARHADLRRLIEGLTDAVLFEKKRFAWTGTSTLGSYAVSATSSHDHWAYDLIRKWKKGR
ncbi:MAG: ClbS/DfsB family four-helix bundle protein [Anaerolineae bacterium]|nr:ClbS/DfsB family four-helix bundle protein [Anaerolineae bacterium]